MMVKMKLDSKQRAAPTFQSTLVEHQEIVLIHLETHKGRNKTCKKRPFFFSFGLKEPELQSGSFFMTFAQILKASGEVCFEFPEFFLLNYYGEERIPQDGL